LGAVSNLVSLRKGAWKKANLNPRKIFLGGGDSNSRRGRKHCLTIPHEDGNRGGKKMSER